MFLRVKIWFNLSMIKLQLRSLHQMTKCNLFKMKKAIMIKQQNNLLIKLRINNLNLLYSQLLKLKNNRLRARKLLKKDRRSGFL